MLLLATVVGWGISWPFLKIALTEIPPWTFRGLIAPAAAILVFGIGALLKHDLGRPTGQWREITLAALLNITFWHVFSAFGIKLLGGGQASIIAYTMPLWAVLFSTWLIRETLNPARVAGISAGMAGLAVLVVAEQRFHVALPAPGPALPLDDHLQLLLVFPALRERARIARLVLRSRPRHAEELRLDGAVDALERPALLQRLGDLVIRRVHLPARHRDSAQPHRTHGQLPCT